MIFPTQSQAARKWQGWHQPLSFSDFKFSTNPQYRRVDRGVSERSPDLWKSRCPAQGL